MATDRQKQAISELSPVIEEIAGIDPQSLAQKERLGSELSFEFIVPLMDEIVNAAKSIKNTNLERIPYVTLSQASSAFQTIQKILKNIEDFSPTQQPTPPQQNPQATRFPAAPVTRRQVIPSPQNSEPPGERRKKIANSLEDTWGQAYPHVQAILGNQVHGATNETLNDLTAQINAAIRKSNDVYDSSHAKQREVEKSLEDFLEDRQRIFDQQGSERLKQIDNALNEVRKVAKEAGITQTHIHFQQEADEHKTSSRWWLGATAISLVLLVVFSLYGTQFMDMLGLSAPASTDIFPNIRYLGQKALAVFCLIFALIMSAKNYGAARHNFVVNKHRNNALNSFQAFSNGTSDEQTKNAVLIQATQSIFTPQATGYVKNDGDNSPHAPIIETLRFIRSEK